MLTECICLFLPYFYLMKGRQKMSEQTLIDNCSPTMAGLKTGNLFSCFFESKKELMSSIRRLNLRLVPRGIRMIPIKIENGRALIYVYRPDRLTSDLSDSTAKAILKSRLYPSADAQSCVAELVRRVKTEKSFPHEIGLFLGYPSFDVDGFIKNKAKGAKCVGTWKVYGDEEEAKKKFALYKKCTRVYKQAYKKHNSFDRLLVSSSK